MEIRAEDYPENVRFWKETYGALLCDLFAGEEKELDAQKVGEWLFMTQEGWTLMHIINSELLMKFNSVDRDNPQTTPESYFANLSDYATVLISNYGLMGFPKETLEKTAARLGTGRERVRQKKWKAVRMMRHPSRLRNIRTFLHPFYDQLCSA